jgi:CIC family chloride channel protein
MKSIRVADFMQPLAAGEVATLAEGDREVAVRSDESLEAALRLFDGRGAERIPVVEPHDRSKIVGWATQLAALGAFNKELIAANVEEHR